MQLYAFDILALDGDDLRQHRLVLLARRWTYPRRPIGCAPMKPRKFALLVLFWLAPAVAWAGNCLSRPEMFKLKSDTVEWSFAIGRGAECLQGLRGRTMLLDTVSILDQPKLGEVVLQGPSFRYVSGAKAGTDSFRLAISGTSGSFPGTSIVSLRVDVQ